MSEQATCGRVSEFTVQRVEFMPDKFEPGVLYISFDYSTAIHLCACGCGQQTVTPFGRGSQTWDLIENERGVYSLHPSIGNFRMPCRSHYFIEHNKVRWC